MLAAVCLATHGVSKEAGKNRSEKTEVRRSEREGRLGSFPEPGGHVDTTAFLCMWLLTGCVWGTSALYYVSELCVLCDRNEAVALLCFPHVTAV